MICYRAVSAEEFLILLGAGVVNDQTAPFAVIQKEECLRDTDPPPPHGVVMLFKDLWAAEMYADKNGLDVIILDINPEKIVWQGKGKYHIRDYFTRMVDTIIVNEVAVRQIESKEVVGVGRSLVDHIVSEVRWCIKTKRNLEWKPFYLCDENESNLSCFAHYFSEGMGVVWAWSLCGEIPVCEKYVKPTVLPVFLTETVFNQET